MKTYSEKGTAHDKTRQRLLTRMEELLAVGETCLPGLREMSQEFGVSLMTVNKAVCRLAMEGRIQRVPRKGNFILKSDRTLNLGIVLCKPPDLSFVRSPAVLQGMLEVFDRATCYVRILHLASPERLDDACRKHALDACVWYLPDPGRLPKLNKVLKHFGKPVLVVGEAWDETPDIALPPFYVATDYQAIGRNRAEYLIKRGHRHIAYFNEGSSAQNLEHNSSLATLAVNGIATNPLWTISSEEATTRIPQLLDEGRITAAIVKGGTEALETVFQVINNHPAGGRLELLVDYVGPSLEKTMAQHPRVKVVGVNVHPNRKLGVVAAQTLLDHLLLGKAANSTKVSSFIVAPGEVKQKSHWKEVE